MEIIQLCLFHIQFHYLLSCLGIYFFKNIFCEFLFEQCQLLIDNYSVLYIIVQLTYAMVPKAETLSADVQDENVICTLTYSIQS